MIETWIPVTNPLQDKKADTKIVTKPWNSPDRNSTNWSLSLWPYGKKAFHLVQTGNSEWQNKWTSDAENI